MKWCIVFLFIVCVVGGCSSAHAAGPGPASKPVNPPPATQPAAEAATAAEYVEYRYQAELGSITIQSGMVRGAKRVEGFEKRAKDLPKRGIFPLVGKLQRQGYVRREKIDGMRVETLVLIDPPAEQTAAAPDPNAIPRQDDEATPAANWSAHLLVRINGRIKVACSIGNSIDGELWIHRVTIHPEDGTLDLLAISSDGQELSLPDDYLRLDDPTVITDQSFFDDDPAVDEHAPVKV